MQYHVNGSLVPASEATVSVRDRGFMYGDAAFETMRAYGGSVFEWDAHCKRLTETCATLGIDHGISDSGLQQRVERTLDVNDLADAYIRLSVTRGVQPGKLTPGPAEDPSVVIVVNDLPRGGVDGESVWAEPATAALTETQRIPDAALPAAAKTHNYLNGILARLDAPDADEALLCDGDGYVTEGATSNLFFVRDGVLHTPSLDGPVLPGITRSVVLELAEDAAIPVETGMYTPADVEAATDVILTNTTWEIRPVDRIGSTAFERSPVTEMLTDAFDELVEQRHYGIP